METKTIYLLDILLNTREHAKETGINTRIPAKPLCNLVCIPCDHIFYSDEQDRNLQQLEKSMHLTLLAIKLTDINNEKNIWIATSIFNNRIKKKFYKEKYAGTLAFILRANGIVK